MPVPPSNRSHEPDVVIVGPVTWDVIDGERRPGGAVTFAARTAEAFGIPLRILAIAGPDADLDAFSFHEVEAFKVSSTLIMEHDQGSSEREIRVPASASNSLVGEDVPDGWDRCTDLVLAPLLPGDLDVGSLSEAIEAERLWVFAQGLQRKREADGLITYLDRPAEPLATLGGADATVFLSEVETDPWPDGALEELTERCRRVIVTQGEAGAVLLAGDEARELPPVAATVVDTTGAGDVFATAFLLALEGDDEAAEARAGRIAAGFAAAAVELAGPAPLPSLETIEAPLDALDEDRSEDGGATPQPPSARGRP